MNEKLLTELIEFVKNASTFVWTAFYKQVYVEGLQTSIGAVILGVVGLLLINYTRRNKDEEINFGVGMFGVAALVFSVVLILASFGKFINPNYYAIQMIINQIR